MHSRSGKVLSPQRHILMLAVLLLIMMSATLVSAQNVVQPDGRINQVAHFGGDSLYCVDGNFTPTNQYSDFGAGGFRLLNSGGQELWFVPSAVISAAVAEAKETGKGVLVAEGMGSYGPVRIYTYVTGAGDDYFVFSGYDEFGKPNSVEFKFCIPVGPVPQEPGGGDVELCIFFGSPPKLFTGKANVRPEGYPGILIPCDQCPPSNGRNKLNSLSRPLTGDNGYYGYCEERPKDCIIVDFGIKLHVDLAGTGEGDPCLILQPFPNCKTVQPNVVHKSRVHPFGVAPCPF